MRLAIAAVLLCGCSFEARFDDGYRCVPDLPCPDGTACVDGHCLSGTAADDAGAPDGAPFYACSGEPLLIETFEGALDEERWDIHTEGSAVVEAEGGQLRVSPVGPAGSGGVTSEDPYELASGSVIVEVFDPDATENSFQRLELRSGDTALVAMDRYRDSLRVQLDDGATDLITVVWNGVAHHRWRITTGADLVVETAPESGPWTELVSSPSAGLGFVRVRLTAGNYEAENPPPLGFDNLYVCADD